MQFTNGKWLVRDGFRLHPAARVGRLTVRDQDIEMYLPANPSPHRGATLGGPGLTVTLSSPLDGVIRVRVTHFLESDRPAADRFPVVDVEPPVTIHDDAAGVSLTSGPLTARFSREGSWRLAFLYEGQELTASQRPGLAWVTGPDGQGYVREQLPLAVGELVYGLGERFTPLVKNGQRIDTWNLDGGTDTHQAYKNMPFYLTNRGYGVLVNHAGRVSFEVGSERTDAVSFSVPGETLEYLVIAGDGPKGVLERYTKLTGRPALPPAWSFGLWLSTSFTTDYNSEIVLDMAEGMRARDIPLSVFHFDCFWMPAYTWTSFEWDRERFPNPPALLQTLHDQGLHVSVWINAYIGQASPRFSEAVEHGYLLRRPDGRVWQTDEWQPGMGIVDFTNPEAAAWFQAHLHGLVAQGVDAFKTDFGERIPVEAVFHDGGDPERHHNVFPLHYNRTVFEALQAAGKQPVVFARSATVGSQAYPVHWGGDSDSTYPSLAGSLRAGLSLGLAGFGFWSHDIGGFSATPEADLYKRWVAFGLLSSHSRLHADSSYRVPWAFDDEAVDVLRHFVRLKLRLMPYLYEKAREAAQRGLPMMRAMMLEFPEDPACAALERQYMLGDALLVAPVMDRSGAVTYYLPAGSWTHLLSGRTMTSPHGRFVTEAFDYFSLPVYVRQGTLLAWGASDERPDYRYAENVQFHLFSLADGQNAACRVQSPAPWDDDALTVRVERSGSRLAVRAAGRLPDEWSLVLRGIGSDQVTGDRATLTVHPHGTMVRPDASHRDRLDLTLV